MIELVRARGPAAIADEMLPRLLSTATRERQPGIVSAVRSMIEATSVEGIAGSLGAMMARPDATPSLSHVNCPALILVGAHDVITPEARARAMEQRIERSRVVVLPDAGHLSNIESPDTFSRALTDFLASNM
jgi:pimeloyl-ACP methyl ester carboxylesterase